jgi:hypothetical protein
MLLLRDGVEFQRCVVSLNRQSGGNDFQRGENDFAQHHDDEDYSKFVERNLFIARYVWIHEFKEMQLPDRQQ